MMEPNKENIRKWVEALRSGKYKQGYCCLGNGSYGYCCLGVACVVSGATDWNSGQTKLSPSAMAWLGLDRPSPRIDGISLANRNDMDGESFAEIADRIEAEWLAEAA